MWRLLQYSGRDNREYLAPIYHILLNTTKNKNEELSYDDFFWIINKANCKHMWKYFSTIVPYDFLFVYDEVPLILKNFEADWDANYKIDINGKIKKDKAGKAMEYKNFMCKFGYKGFLSQATLEDLNSTIKAWKIYGKYLIRINNFFSKIKRFIKNAKNN